jgi:hypothetical protein
VLLGTLDLSPFSSHAGARPSSRDAGGSGKAKDSNKLLFSLYQTPARPRSGPTKFLGTRLGLRKRPQGDRALSEAAGRVCAGERTWP